MSHDFLEIERDIARSWRADLHDPDRDRKIGILRNILRLNTPIPDLAALKLAIDEFCDRPE